MMGRISLKNIVGKNNELNSIILGIISQSNAAIWIEDHTGKLLLGEKIETENTSFPIFLEDELKGWVKGDEKGIIIVKLLTYLLEKEAEKKNWGRKS
jgi:hypothetical protein